MDLGVTIALLDDAKHVTKRQPLRLVRGDARQRLGHRIQVFDVPVQVGGDHRVADRLQRDLRPIALSE